MAYTPTEWKTGDIVTSEKLNKVENELASAVMTINATIYSDAMAEAHASTDPYVRMDKTAGEIYEAFRSWTRCLLVFPEGSEIPGSGMTFAAVLPITSASVFTNSDTGETTYIFGAPSPIEPQVPMGFYATSADAYPTTEEPGSIVV